MKKSSAHWLPALAVLGFLGLAITQSLAAPEPFTVLELWKDTPPGPPMEVGPETDFTKPTDRLIAGRRIIKLGNVQTPQVHVFVPPKEKNNGAAVVICPGGGFSILAWDLEGTEVAEWLNTLGVTAVVLKYRVPTRTQNPRWRAPVQDAQRALSLTRHHAASWNLDPKRLGILGFSAGGETAGLTSLLAERQYEAGDAIDNRSCLPDFSILIYAAGFVTEDKTALKDYIRVTAEAPPTFFVHAFDDGVPVENSLLLFGALKRQGVPSDLHVYSRGGHGYGLRATELPVTDWPKRCEAWLRTEGFLSPPRD